MSTCSWKCIPAAALASSMLLACGGGDDVYLRSERYGTERSALECGLVSGADICAWPMDDVAPADRARVAAALQAVVDLATVTDEALGELEAGCRAVVDATGLAPYRAPQRLVDERARTECHTVEDILRNLPPGSLRVDVQLASCIAAAPPACAMPAARERVTCAPAVVTATAAPEAGLEAFEIARALTNQLGRILGTKQRLETAASLASEISEASSALEAAPPGCTGASVELAKQSVADLSLAVDLTARVTAAL